MLFRSREVVLELRQPSPEMHKGGGFLGDGVLLGFRASLCQKPLSDSLAAPGLFDELDQRVDEHGGDRGGLDRVVAALGVAAVVVAAAGVLQLVSDRDAVHHAAATLGKVDDPSRKGVAIWIVRFLAILPTDLVDRFLFRLQSLPATMQ